MKVTLIQVFFLTGILTTTGHGFDREPTESDGLTAREETGVMTQGTISDLRPDQILVTSSCSLEPIRYFHGEGTIYVNENGDPISVKIVKSGVPVILFYTQSENSRIANRVIVGTTSVPTEFLIEF